MIVWLGTSLNTGGTMFLCVSTSILSARQLAQDGSSTYTSNSTYYVTLFLDQAMELDKPCSSHYKTVIATINPVLPLVLKFGL